MFVLGCDPTLPFDKPKLVLHLLCHPTVGLLAKWCQMVGNSFLLNKTFVFLDLDLELGKSLEKL